MRTLPTVAVLSLLLIPQGSWGFPLYELTQATAVSPPFSRNVYRCAACTLADFGSLTPPAGFTQSPPLEALFSSVVSSPVPDPGSAALSIDVIASIPGNEFELVAQIVAGQILGFLPSGPFVRLDIKRQTTFTYDAGTVVHELTDPLGDRFVLFAAPQDLSLAGLPGTTDLSQLGALATLVLPAGWSYSSQMLASALDADSQGLADVVTTGQLSFQRVPELGATGALAMVALALIGRRWRGPYRGWC